MNDGNSFTVQSFVLGVCTLFWLCNVGREIFYFIFRQLWHIEVSMKQPWKLPHSLCNSSNCTAGQQNLIPTRILPQRISFETTLYINYFVNFNEFMVRLFQIEWTDYVVTYSHAPLMQYFNYLNVKLVFFQVWCWLEMTNDRWNGLAKRKLAATPNSEWIYNILDVYLICIVCYCLWCTEGLRIQWLGR